MGSEEIKELILVSTDGVEYTISRELANCFVTIKKMLENTKENDKGIPQKCEVIVKGNILKLTIDWASEYLKTKNAVKVKNKTTNGTYENIDYCPNIIIKPDELFELIISANYLDFKPLLDASCKLTANILKTETPDGIRSILNIKNDFSPIDNEND